MNIVIDHDGCSGCVSTPHPFSGFFPGWSQHGPGVVSLAVPLLDLSYPCLSLGCYSLLGECPGHSDGVSPLGSHQSSLALLSTLPSMYLKKVPSTPLAEHPGHPQDSYPGLAGCWPCYLMGFFSSESLLVLLGINELDSRYQQTCIRS
jgi:hypothetical protein